jgi:hypothetical protein
VKKMSRASILAVLTAALISIAAAGCGSNGGGNNTAMVASTFAGHWAGPWTDSNGKQGTLDVVVGTDGKLTGSVVDTTDAMNGSVTGAATNTGSLNATEVYPGPTTVGITGTVSIGANGHLAGVVQTSQAGQPSGSGNFDLAKQ